MGFFLVFLIVLLLDFYVFQGIRSYFSTHPSEVFRNLSYILFWGVSIAIPLFFLLGMQEYKTSQQMSRMFVVAGNIWLVLFISKIAFVLVMFGEDAYRLGSAAYTKWVLKPVIDDTVDSGFMASRRKFVMQGAFALAALPLISLTYGMIKGRYQYKIHKQQLFFKDLPEAFDGFTITQISDVHSGSFDDREGVLKGLEMIQSLNSDLIVFTGDLVNTYASEFDPWVADFASLKAPFGKYSILGNHDYGDYAKWANLEDKQKNFESLIDHHRNMGFRLMMDEAEHIEKDGATISLMGVENWGLGFGKRGKLHKALETVRPDAFKILLSHDPTHWENEVKSHDRHIHLTMSGHTHGMQMGIEIPGFKWSPIQYRYPKWAGVYQENDRYLYINRGFGVLGFRGRVGIWPEITQIELKRAV